MEWWHIYLFTRIDTVKNITGLLYFFSSPYQRRKKPQPFTCYRNSSTAASPKKYNSYQKSLLRLSGPKFAKKEARDLSEYRKLKAKFEGD